MGTTPTPSPMVLIKNELSWLQKHERIIIVALVLLVGCFLGNKWLDNRIANAETKVTVAEQRLEDQKKANETLAAQALNQVTQYQQMVDSLTKQNVALLGAISQRDAALKQKQETIKTMPLPQVATEWETLLKLPQGVLSVLSVAPTSISVPDAAARETVTVLESVPVLKADLTDAITLGNNYKAQAASCQAVVDTQVKQIAGLNTQIVDADKACKAEVAKVKAVGRKAKIKWFLTGFVSGLLARSAIQGL